MAFFYYFNWNSTLSNLLFFKHSGLLHLVFVSLFSHHSNGPILGWGSIRLHPLTSKHPGSPLRSPSLPMPPLIVVWFGCDCHPLNHSKITQTELQYSCQPKEVPELLLGDRRTAILFAQFHRDSSGDNCGKNMQQLGCSNLAWLLPMICYD